MNYTLTLAGDNIVQKQLDMILPPLIEQGPKTVLLFGSYGKGEGAIINGRPSNDLDLLVISEVPINVDYLKDLSLDTYPEIHLTDGIDFSVCTQQLYEMAYGSILLHGEPVAWPAWEAYDIPFSDAVNSIDRRIVSLLVGKHEMFKEAPNYRKITEQIAKAIIAIGDATLIRTGQFHPSYFTRAIMLEVYPAGELYQMAVSLKVLDTPKLNPDQLWTLWNTTKSMVREYCMENSIRPSLLDMLLRTDDDIDEKELHDTLVSLGAEAWL